MRNKFYLAFAGSLIGLAVAAPASAIVIGNADSNAADYVSLATTPGFTHGSAAYNQAFSSVGQIFGLEGTSLFAGSGVLLQNNWVLTAAHITSGATSLKFY